MDNNWSIEAIQETAASNWSLEGDNQLLNLMKSISKNLEQRCMTSNNNLNRLMLDVDKTKIKLGNATTKLLDLNNGKFVEHTVMDMDAIVSNTEKGMPAENEKIFVPLPKAVEEAVTNGLNMMDRCYEKVLLNLEDSDDEDDNENGQKHAVCRPKDPYQNRPLPHLIGSKQWNDKWHVGLIESDEEVLSDEEPEEPEFSQSSSDEGDSLSNSPRTSNPQTTSESDFAVPVPAVIHHEDLFHRLDDDSETKSQLFAPVDRKHLEKVKVLPTINPQIKDDEPVNKTKQLTEPPVPVLEQPKKQQPQQQQSIFVQQKTEPKFLNLFDDEPPTLDEPIRHERKPVNLFLDSDDEEDNKPTANTQKPTSIFNDSVTSRPTVPFSIPQMANVPQVDKTKREFNGDADNNTAKSEIKSSTLKSNDFGGLFDDEPPDDFFDIIVREQKGKSADNSNAGKPKLQSKTVNLFDSDDDDDDFSKIIGTTTKRDSIASAVSSKESAPVVKQTDSSYSPFSSPFNSPFRSTKSHDPPKSYVSFLDDESPVVEDIKNETAAPDKQFSRASLFDDTPPDDIFVPAVPSKPKTPTKIIYDDIAATLKETSSSTTNISSKDLGDETPDDTKVEVPPVIQQQKPELKVRPNDAVVQSTPTATNRTSVLSSEPKSDASSRDKTDDTKVEVPPVILPRKPELKVRPNDAVVKSKPIATDRTSVLSSEPKSDASSRDETDQSLTFRKNLSLFSNPAATTLPNVDKETKPKPNKLKANFNINVAALLPGAKLPSQKQSPAEKPERTVDPDPEPNQIGKVSKDNAISVSNTKQTNSSEDTSGRLTCLGKDRAKIQVQRKPSTRMGRRKLYNKTLSSENENIVSPVETTDSVEPEPETDTNEQDIKSAEPAEVEQLKLNVQEPHQVSDSLSGALSFDPPPDSNDSNTNVVADDDEEDWLKTIDEKPPSPGKTILYDEDWLSAKPVNEEPKPATQSMSHVMNYDWLTASSLPPEDTNPPSNYSIDDDHEQDDWLSSYVTKEKSSVVADLPNDDDDWLMAAQVTVSTAAGANRKDEAEVEKDWLLQATLVPEKNINETADDDDWLTKSLAPPKESSTVTDDKMSVSDPINKKITDDPQVVRSDAVNSSAETRQTIKSGLFDSDNESPVADEVVGSRFDVSTKSSDIFESKVATKKFLSSTIFDDDEDVTAVPSYLGEESKSEASKQHSTKTVIGGENSDTLKAKTETKKSLNSTLFDDDDDDDDDDLFGSVKQKKSSAKQITTEAVKPTKSVSIKTAAKSSLFSDDDNSDSDDLFGTTAKKQKDKIEAGPKQPKMDKPTKTSLFDDEDDDDEDIFAPKTQKRVTQADAKRKSSVATKSMTTIPASSDPLADLLK